MKIQKFPKPQPQGPAKAPAPKGLLPFSFKNEEKTPDDQQDWGMNPNPNGYRPNWKLVGICTAGGVSGGVSLGMLGGSYFGISPVPFVAAGVLMGAYLGANIALAFPLTDPK